MEMENFEDILKQLRNEHGELDTNLHIIEEIIPIDEQMKYFDHSRHVRSPEDIHNRGYWVATLFAPEGDLEQKKLSLSILAGLVDVGAYRALETYHSSPLEPELANWSAMALMESKILISSDLSGEKQVLISTGLGGIARKLRFFAVIPSLHREEFTPLQVEMLTREFNFQLEKKKIDIEEFTFAGNYLKIVLLADIESDLKTVFKNVIVECNEYGNFIDENFLLTNVRKFEDSEIIRLLAKKKNTENENN